MEFLSGRFGSEAILLRYLRFLPGALEAAATAGAMRDLIDRRSYFLADRARRARLVRRARLPVSRAQRHGGREATRQLVALDPPAPRIDAAQRLLQAMAEVPAVKLTSPSGYASLPAVTALLATLA